MSLGVRASAVACNLCKPPRVVSIVRTRGAAAAAAMCLALPLTACSSQHGEACTAPTTAELRDLAQRADTVLEGAVTGHGAFTLAPMQSSGAVLNVERHLAGATSSDRIAVWDAVQFELRTNTRYVVFLLRLEGMTSAAGEALPGYDLLGTGALVADGDGFRRVCEGRGSKDVRSPRISRELLLTSLR